MAVILAMTAIGAWAVATDRVSYVVTNGISMNPLYHAGDLVFVIRADSYHVGQIAAYHGSTPGLKVLHRIIGGDAQRGYIFKGDNNQSIDPITPTADKLIGRALLHVPKGGLWLKPLLSPTGLGMMGFLFVSGGAAAPRTRREIPRGRRKKKVGAMSRQGGAWASADAVVKTMLRLSPLLRAAAVLTATAAVSGLTLAVLGWMQPVTKAVHDRGTTQSVTYSYSATVPRSPAYDGTTVKSPDPIFRKLAHLVDIHVRYRGHPGALEVTAKLSTSSGWHTTLKVLPPTSLSGNDDDTIARLDLDALENRAQAAAKAIGTDLGTLKITIIARVTASGKKEFTAPLQFMLTPLQLVLANEDNSLETIDSAGTAGVAPRDIEVFGRYIMTATSARAYAILLLLGVSISASAITLSARRKSPLRARSDIERRYSQLLVPVEPMASPPGKPVVSVDNFPALVRLAERYGQMILTWSRPDADDFVVRDEGITYRYRINLDEQARQNLDDIDRPPTAGTHRRTASSPMS